MRGGDLHRTRCRGASVRALGEVYGLGGTRAGASAGQWGMRCVRVSALALGLTLAAAGASAQSDDFGGLPEGEGRIETYANCITCHSTMIIRQQRLPHRTWDEVLTWMVEEKGMWEMAPEVRAKVLDYLAEHFGPDAPR